MAPWAPSSSFPVPESPSLTQALSDLCERGIRCLAAHPHADRPMLSQANFTGDCCIVFGSEGYGLSRRPRRVRRGRGHPHAPDGGFPQRRQRRRRLPLPGQSAEEPDVTRRAVLIGGLEHERAS